MNPVIIAMFWLAASVNRQHYTVLILKQVGKNLNYVNCKLCWSFLCDFTIPKRISVNPRQQIFPFLLSFEIVLRAALSLTTTAPHSHDRKLLCFINFSIVLFQLYLPQTSCIVCYITSVWHVCYNLSLLPPTSCWN